MSQELVLTAINTTFKFCSVRSDFEGWLKDAGASEITIRNYVAAIQKWLKVLALSPEERPAVIWQRSQMSASIKRVVGYACRRYAMFAAEVLGQRIDLGTPSRLPVASRPNPKPICDKQLRELSIAAKKIFPKETSISFRVWLQFLNETGCRRSESEIDWSSIDWLRRSVIVRGKTGERELPLSRKMIRTLQFLFRRRRSAPWTGCRSQMLSAGVLYCLFKKAAEKIGRPDLRPHLMRHRRLTRLCSSALGTDPLLVLSFAGQSSLSSLQYYYRVSLEEKRRLLTVK
ncbi:MAG: site-specific integrase [Verrucomicrobia bacterium]|nr:site-specific integrase [Verrucomicrobiota bacterium]